MKKPTNSQELKELLDQVDGLLTENKAPALHVMCMLNSLFEDENASSNFNATNIALAKSLWTKLARSGITLKEPPILAR
jgi:hypothetical protein